MRFPYVEPGRLGDYLIRAGKRPEGVSEPPQVVQARRRRRERERLKQQGVQSPQGGGKPGGNKHRDQRPQS